MSRLSEIIHKYFLNGPDVSLLEEKRRLLREEVAAWEKDFESMHGAFSQGGIVTWEQLATYRISTPDKPVGYPTGKNCLSFRLPDLEGRMIFYTVCVAPEGEVGCFGWHHHPKTNETNIQLEGTAEHDGKPHPPFSVTVFPAGTPHDYILQPGGSLITVFEKVTE